MTVNEYSELPRYCFLFFGSASLVFLSVVQPWVQVHFAASRRGVLAALASSKTGNYFFVAHITKLRNARAACGKLPGPFFGKNAKDMEKVQTIAGKRGARSAPLCCWGNFLYFFHIFCNFSKKWPR